eukprot:jgi/Mesvir1/8548/Mv18703-RA.1
MPPHWGPDVARGQLPCSQRVPSPRPESLVTLAAASLRRPAELEVARIAHGPPFSPHTNVRACVWPATEVLTRVLMALPPDLLPPIVCPMTPSLLTALAYATLRTHQGAGDAGGHVAYCPAHPSPPSQPPVKRRRTVPETESGSSGDDPSPPRWHGAPPPYLQGRHLWVCLEEAWVQRTAEASGGGGMAQACASNTHHKEGAAATEQQEAASCPTLWQPTLCAQARFWSARLQQLFDDAGAARGKASGGADTARGACGVGCLQCALVWGLPHLSHLRVNNHMLVLAAADATATTTTTTAAAAAATATTTAPSTTTADGTGPPAGKAAVEPPAGVQGETGQQVPEGNGAPPPPCTPGQGHATMHGEGGGIREGAGGHAGGAAASLGEAWQLLARAPLRELSVHGVRQSGLSALLALVRAVAPSLRALHLYHARISGGVHPRVDTAAPSRAPGALLAVPVLSTLQVQEDLARQLMGNGVASTGGGGTGTGDGSSRHSTAPAGGQEAPGGGVAAAHASDSLAFLALLDALAPKDVPACCDGASMGTTAGAMGEDSCCARPAAQGVATPERCAGGGTAVGSDACPWQWQRSHQVGMQGACMPEGDTCAASCRAFCDGSGGCSHQVGHGAPGAAHGAAWLSSFSLVSPSVALLSSDQLERWWWGVASLLWRCRGHLESLCLYDVHLPAQALDGATSEKLPPVDAAGVQALAPRIMHTADPMCSRVCMAAPALNNTRATTTRGRACGYVEGGIHVKSGHLPGTERTCDQNPPTTLHADSTPLARQPPETEHQPPTCPSNASAQPPERVTSPWSLCPPSHAATSPPFCQGVPPLPHVLCYLARLHRLQLVELMLGDTFVDAWGAALGGGTSGHPARVHEAQAVRRLPSLRELCLRGNEIGGEGARGLARLLVWGLPGLQVLDLSHNPLGDEGARALADALLAATGSAPEAHSAPAEVATSCPPMAPLDARPREAGVGPREASGAPLRPSWQVTRLLLSRCGFSPAGCGALFQALASIPTTHPAASLRHLDVSGNRMDDRALAALASMLRAHAGGCAPCACAACTVEHGRGRGGSVTAPCAVASKAHAIQSGLGSPLLGQATGIRMSELSAGISVLDVSDVGLDGSRWAPAWATLCHAVSSHPTLQRLVISRNRLGADVGTRLALALLRGCGNSAAVHDAVPDHVQGKPALSPAGCCSDAGIGANNHANKWGNGTATAATGPVQVKCTATGECPCHHPSGCTRGDVGTAAPCPGVFRKRPSLDDAMGGDGSVGEGLCVAERGAPLVRLSHAVGSAPLLHVDMSATQLGEEGLRAIAAALGQMATTGLARVNEGQMGRAAASTSKGAVGRDCQLLLSVGDAQVTILQAEGTKAGHVQVSSSLPVERYGAQSNCLGRLQLLDLRGNCNSTAREVKAAFTGPKFMEVVSSDLRLVENGLRGALPGESSCGHKTLAGLQIPLGAGTQPRYEGSCRLAGSSCVVLYSSEEGSLVTDDEL